MPRLEGHNVSIAENGQQGVDQMRDAQFDLVITDLIMPEQEGLETIADIRKNSSELPIIAISGGGRVDPMDYLKRARFIGADATLAKPFGRQELNTTVADLLAG
jgi:DNA-binding response OmpR family regulator